MAESIGLHCGRGYRSSLWAEYGREYYGHLSVVLVFTTVWLEKKWVGIIAAAALDDNYSSNLRVEATYKKKSVEECRMGDEKRVFSSSESEETQQRPNAAVYCLHSCHL